MMERQRTSDKVKQYLVSHFNTNDSIFLPEIYRVFPNISPNTIRSVIKRLNDSGELVKVRNGSYVLPNKGILSVSSYRVSELVNAKYIFDNNGRRIGYRTGINLANELGLTSQTSSVDDVISNAVSNRKREIKYNKNRIIINAPRIKISDENYRLLQVLDLLNNFDKYSDFDIKYSFSKLMNYIGKLKLDLDEIDAIISSYPLTTQVKFYKMGGLNVITSSQ